MDANYVGVDGGGTRTRAVVAGRDLVPRGRGASGPANAASNPVPRVVEAVREAVDDALSAAGVSHTSVACVSCGLAGVESTAAGTRLRAALEGVYGEGRVVVTTDARIALAGATEGPPGTPGVVLIAGTGAIAFGANPRGDEARAGGWGPIIGDEGSGYDIARRGLAAVVRSLDGRGPHTFMADALLLSEGTRSVLELVQKLNRAGEGPRDVGAYFPIVLSAARRGDSSARSILEEAGEELALAAVTVVKKLEMAHESFLVAATGGVFSAGELILSPIRRRLAAEAPHATLGPPAHAPDIGAIRLALAMEASRVA